MVGAIREVGCVTLPGVRPLQRGVRRRVAIRRGPSVCREAVADRALRLYFVAGPTNKPRAQDRANIPDTASLLCGGADVGGGVRRKLIFALGSDLSLPSDKDGCRDGRAQNWPRSIRENGGGVTIESPAA